MKAPSPDDTIVAVSTPPGHGGLGVVRLSGDRALEIARTFFRPARPRARFEDRRAVLGVLVDPEKNESFDEAVLTSFRGPGSFTREDVVEISCHGSQVILEEVVRLAVRQGARLAHPGEFTRRAFLRGRIDILQ
ncbi:MAG: tRNA uridine-5-carboxymethylaminomethyl(34) synthesis GTPase MnmE, partial [Candidatus Aminicenantes bacterium]|nr:tRNA uridine-5-carboxymethylaminomethyl(34) synthesis GTPase MnmE [Candidatus Aminicenantes bacterium]